MGFFDRLFGSDQPARPSARSADEIAIERYRYLLKTAPPETIEEVHREAFSKLTPDQRQLLFDGLTENAPAGDAPKSPEPAALAASATRSELRNPGVLERTMAPSAFGGGAGGMGFGSMFASSLLGSVAGYVIGSAIVGTFMNGFDDNGSTDASADSNADASTDSGADASADGGGYDAGGFDSGFDGGGDFGGGDFF